MISPVQAINIGLVEICDAITFIYYIPMTMTTDILFLNSRRYSTTIEFATGHWFAYYNLHCTLVTARIKGMLRHKNRLMRTGRTEKASAIAKRIGKCITSRK